MLSSIKKRLAFGSSWGKHSLVLGLGGDVHGLRTAPTRIKTRKKEEGLGKDGFQAGSYEGTCRQEKGMVCFGKSQGDS